MDHCTLCGCTQFESETEIVNGRIVHTYYCENCGHSVSRYGKEADTDFCLDDEVYEDYE